LGILSWLEFHLQKSFTDTPPAPRVMRKLPALAWVFCLSALATLALPAHAQKVDKTPRKLVFKQSPHYPLMLKEAHIGGVVRLEIVISPKGNVDTISPLGGNPVLVEAASTAVKKWKYLPGESETKTQVEFTFDPTH
jgi:TonB family protein